MQEAHPDSDCIPSSHLIQYPLFVLLQNPISVKYTKYSYIQWLDSFIHLISSHFCKIVPQFLQFQNPISVKIYIWMNRLYHVISISLQHCSIQLALQAPSHPNSMAEFPWPPRQSLRSSLPTCRRFPLEPRSSRETTNGLAGRGVRRLGRSWLGKNLWVTPLHH